MGKGGSSVVMNVTSRGFAKIVLALFTALVGMQVVSRSRPEVKGNIPWRSSYVTARAESAKARIPMVLLFTASWCDNCRYLKSETLTDRRIETLLKDAVVVEINTDDPANAPLMAEYKVNAIPAMVVVSGQGHKAASIVGMASPEELINRLGPSLMH